jgi:negative regulator of sigma E activity
VTEFLDMLTPVDIAAGVLAVVAWTVALYAAHRGRRNR